MDDLAQIYPVKPMAGENASAGDPRYSNEGPQPGGGYVEKPGGQPGAAPHPNNAPPTAAAQPQPAMQQPPTARPQQPSMVAVPNQHGQPTNGQQGAPQQPTGAQAHMNAQFQAQVQQYAAALQEQNPTLTPQQAM